MALKAMKGSGLTLEQLNQGCTAEFSVVFINYGIKEECVGLFGRERLLNV